ARTPTTQREGPYIDNRKLSHRPAPSEPRPPGRQQPSARGPTSTPGSSVIVRPRANRVRQDANTPARGAPHRQPEAQSSSGPERTASARTPTTQREGPHIDNRKLSHRPAPSEGAATQPSGMYPYLPLA